MLSYIQSIFQTSSSKRQSYLNEQKKIKQNNLKRKVYEELNFLQELEEYKQISRSRKEQIIKIKSAKKLNEMIIKREVSCVELIIIFGEIALNKGFVFNLITDCFIKEAYMKAQEKDKKLSEYILGENKSIFYGLPISIKDNVIKKGSDSTLGCCSYVNIEQEQDGVIVQFIEEELMGIIIVKSNIPQLNMLNESINEIFGAAKNPLDISRTPGGSSGGESGLVQLGASILGIGTDIGGSLRGPAACTGLVSLKPSENRTSSKGLFFPNPYNLRPNLNIVGIPGCIVNNSIDLQHFQQAFFNSNIISSQDFTKSITPFNSLIFNSTLNKSKIRLGYLITDSYFKACDSIQRGMHEIVQKLQNDSRFELVNIMDINIDNKYFNSKDIIENYIGIMGAEGGLKNFIRILKGDQMLKEYDMMVKASKIPRCLKGSISWLLKMLGEKRIGDMVKISYGRSYDEFQELSLKQMIMQQKMYNMLIENELSGIILPCSVIPAMKHHQSQKLFIHCYYTFIFNLMKMPAAVLPITQVRDNEQFYTDSNNNDSLTKLTHLQMINSKGLPVNIQLAALPGQDENLLAILQILESKIAYSNQFNL